MKTVSIKKYLKRLAQLAKSNGLNTKYVIVPDSVVEAAFNRQPSTISKWKKMDPSASPLTLIEIDGKRYVTLPCVVERIKLMDYRMKTVEERLVAHINSNSTKDDHEIRLHYTETMGWVDLNVSIPADRKEFGLILGELSTRSFNLLSSDNASAEPFSLTALITEQATNLPSSGFFDLVKIHAPDMAVGRTMEEIALLNIRRARAFYSTEWKDD